jgi:hypothetical protein
MNWIDVGQDQFGSPSRQMPVPFYPYALTLGPVNARARQQSQVPQRRLHFMATFRRAVIQSDGLFLLGDTKGGRISH